ncbi:MAG: DUF1194 domain-containing protein [Leptolyngbyaceae cyanobacterium]
MMSKRNVFKAALVVSVGVVVTTVSAIDANAAVLELGLLIDGSGSIEDDDFGLQLAGYKDAFTDPNFFSNIVEKSEFNSIVIGAFQFGGPSSSPEVVEEIPWTSITNQSEAEAFGNLFNTSVFEKLDGFTPIGAGIDTITESIFNNAFTSDKQIIDISTDGAATSQLKAETAAQAAYVAGIDALNAIGIALDASDEDDLKTLTFDETGVAGSGLFFEASTFEDFGPAIKTKLGEEIAGKPVPEPASLLGLTVLGLVGLGSRVKSRLDAEG